MPAAYDIEAQRQPYFVFMSMCTIAIVIISTRLYPSKLVTDSNVFQNYNVTNSNKILNPYFAGDLKKGFFYWKSVYSEFTDGHLWACSEVRFCSIF